MAGAGAGADGSAASGSGASAVVSSSLWKTKVTLCVEGAVGSAAVSFVAGASGVVALGAALVRADQRG